jgi:PAS domain S-box-containing protein
VVEQSPDGIYLIDVETKRVFEVNRAFAQMMGYTSEEILELSIYDIVAADREDVEQKFEEIVQKEALFYERQIRRKDGSILDVWISAGVISYEGRKVVCVVVHDITERKRAEERICIYQNQLRSLASELSLAEERERRRIASELHDHIGQTLAICKIKLGALQELASSTDLTGFCNEIRELIEQMIRYTRSLTADLSPPVLYELGLEAALEWLTERIREQHGILVEFMDDGEDKPMNDEIRVLLFKAVRELLVNVVKHAHPAKAKVSIQRNRGHLRITVQDDGVGFNTLETNSNLGNNGGFGLFSIRERLGHLGGHVEVESERGFGTRVSLVMPLTRNKDKAK